jgi:hypothetical protein
MHAAFARCRPKQQARRDLYGRLDQADAATALKTTPTIINADWLGRRCGRCSGETFLVLAPKRPHANGLQCISCGMHVGWLSKMRAAELAKVTS